MSDPSCLSGFERTTIEMDRFQEMFDRCREADRLEVENAALKARLAELEAERDKAGEHHRSVVAAFRMDAKEATKTINSLREQVGLAIAKWQALESRSDLDTIRAILERRGIRFGEGEYGDWARIVVLDCKHDIDMDFQNGQLIGFVDC